MNEEDPERDLLLLPLGDGGFIDYPYRMTQKVGMQHMETSAGSALRRHCRSSLTSARMRMVGLDVQLPARTDTGYPWSSYVYCSTIEPSSMAMEPSSTVVY